MSDLLRAPGVVLLAVLVVAFGTRLVLAHDTIELDKVNALGAAADAASAQAKAADGPAAEGQARFALGAVLIEATDVLNRDLAAHTGRLTVNAKLLEQALAQRGLAPPFDQTIGRYRLPRRPLEEALRLAPEAPYAPQARFALLKAGFYESFVLDPFQLVGISLEDLVRDIGEAETLAAALSSPDDAEETAFIHAIDLARAARLAEEPQARRAYAGKARAALKAFAAAYPDSMRAAATGLVLKGLGETE